MTLKQGPWLFCLLAFLVGAVLWIEHSNRSTIEPPEVAAYHPCPDSDAMPYGTRCIEFMVGHLPNRPEIAN